MEHTKGCNSCIFYNDVLSDLRKRLEMASSLLKQSGGLNIYEYAFALSESVLEALDEALLYPNIDVLEELRGVLEVEKEF